MKILVKWNAFVWVRRSYLFMRADDIVFEYQVSEFKLGNKIRKL